MTDQELKTRWLNDLNAPAPDLVGSIVKAHAQTYAHLQMQVAIWLNADADPWDQGVDLLELCQVLPADPDANFKPTEYRPSGGWPRLRVILSSFGELNIRLEFEERAGHPEFVTELLRKMHDGEARVVFSTQAFEQAMAIERIKKIGG